MTNAITLVVADDHPLLLKGLIDELKAYNYSILATAENGAQALDKIMQFQPVIAILDEEMPMLTGFEIIKKCKEQNIATKFIILTSHKEKAFVYKAKTLEISGYIIKDEPFQELHKCIQSVRMGVPYFSTLFSDVFENEVAPQLKKIKLLSPSERTILRLVAQEKSSKEIGVLLSVSNRTVEKHRANIIAKLGLVAATDALLLWTKEHREFLENI
ncbi:response regulator transcription factor [Cellulophaga baltica]|uniref:Two component transcriptional regulator, LuxR family n=1 Tax=Cellulophaga baltica TaxID=76594 RepID=A0A1G7GGP2_9FLAO|nr:response regulator transcription factor [Cellulophaga baltica]SDE87300.1 two component transcriptional regulator, LuxR family [Cellulophaga baltica]